MVRLLILTLYYLGTSLDISSSEEVKEIEDSDPSFSVISDNSLDLAKILSIGPLIAFCSLKAS
jgi:hypothetical protein